ncbi:phosphoglucomutase (alpha-D-glucose-1,6-bisphosphate-dependent) [Shewanella surugensis]|uniref:Phosphoglucomutase n=1 Tax=Shewanella surugensis TaxID=212020 RepID=A0ABT0LG54_9GAMM|nr:phosphoglucomutase (alpha-D-glucose-1,6-bisphosphate-dependent) [Shewanella surugensis]MCL1126342.1 phosphoglucomutase (alpha-D-glucose-1,6-bisphosphate-dependent) [Shewanella surugensis]
MSIHPRAGTLATQADLTNIPKLISLYYRCKPNINDVSQRVTFGTSGHRGSALKGSFNEAHILAIAQAVADYRQQAGIKGRLYVGIDTHALSQPASMSVIEVMTANHIEVVIHQAEEFTPTPVISHAIITHNLSAEEQVDGLIITPSHNPPQDGGIKYNPPHGGPAEGEITAWIEARANDYLASQLEQVKRLNYTVAMNTRLVTEVDLIGPYVKDLDKVIDMKAISQAKVRIGVDPLGGAGIHYWGQIASHYNLDIQLVNDTVDPSFRFMPLDKDGKIRMDCSSPYAMAGLLKHQDEFDLCVGNDADYDRHGIVCPGSGLMNPNHFLAVAIDYLLCHRPDWGSDLVVGKTLVSSAMIDKVCAKHQRIMKEVPVGFKWFVEGLADASLAFGGEESAGAAFLRRDGSTWCTDKDGFILALLAAEILAVTGQTPQAHYDALEAKFGKSYYQRLDSRLSLKKKAKFATINAESLQVSTLAGEAITAVLTKAPSNQAAIGGIKVITDNAWFAARPSGTEALFKIYAESFISEAHLAQVLDEATALINHALKG